METSKNSKIKSAVSRIHYAKTLIKGIRSEMIVKVGHVNKLDEDSRVLADFLGKACYHIIEAEQYISMYRTKSKRLALEEQKVAPAAPVSPVTSPAATVQSASVPASITAEVNDGRIQKVLIKPANRLHMLYGTASVKGAPAGIIKAFRFTPEGGIEALIQADNSATVREIPVLWLD